MTDGASSKQNITSEKEYRILYREYVRRLEAVARDPTKRELSDMELLQLLLQPEQVHIFRDIETVMSILVRAALMISVDSIVEFWVREGPLGRCSFLKKWLSSP